MVEDCEEDLLGLVGRDVGEEEGVELGGDRLQSRVRAPQLEIQLTSKFKISLNLFNTHTLIVSILSRLDLRKCI